MRFGAVRRRAVACRVVGVGSCVRRFIARCGSRRLRRNAWPTCVSRLGGGLGCILCHYPLGFPAFIPSSFTLIMAAVRLQLCGSVRRLLAPFVAILPRHTYNAPAPFLPYIFSVFYHLYIIPRYLSPSPFPLLFLSLSLSLALVLYTLLCLISSTIHLHTAVIHRSYHRYRHHYNDPPTHVVSYIFRILYLAYVSIVLVIRTQPAAHPSLYPALVRVSYARLARAYRAPSPRSRHPDAS